MICNECGEGFEQQEDEEYCRDCILNDCSDFESIRGIAV